MEFPTFLTHEYTMAIYGVLLWQVEQAFVSTKPPFALFKQAAKNIGRSMVWVGLIVVFDDELLGKYNEWAAMDYHDAPLWLYTVAGFFIDFIRTTLTKNLIN